MVLSTRYELRRVGRRNDGRRDLIIVYVPKRFISKLKIKVGEQVIVYLPPSEDHIEVWPQENFRKALREGIIKL